MIEPRLGFVDEVSKLSGQNVRRCYYCLRCTAGCPAAYAMEYPPAQLLKMVQLGQAEPLLRSAGLWLCIGCETCGTRCPNDIHAGAVIDALRQMAVARGVAPGERRVFKLHQAFLDSIRVWGRLHELTMLMQYKVTSFDLLSDLDMGLDMFVKGKIHPLPKRIAGIRQVRQLFHLPHEGAGEQPGGRE